MVSLIKRGTYAAFTFKQSGKLSSENGNVFKKRYQEISQNANKFTPIKSGIL